MACPAILEKPLPLVAVIALESDGVTYEISFSTSLIGSAYPLLTAFREYGGAFGVGVSMRAQVPFMHLSGKSS